MLSEDVELARVSLEPKGSELLVWAIAATQPSTMVITTKKWQVVLRTIYGLCIIDIAPQAAFYTLCFDQLHGIVLGYPFPVE